VVEVIPRQLRKREAQIHRGRRCAGKAHVRFGYEVGPDRRLVPVPDEADALRQAFLLRGQGASWQRSRPSSALQ
jgi:hypothetical protein